MHINDIVEMKKENSDHYSKLHTEFKKDEKYYDLEFADSLNLPRKFQTDAVVLPTAREVVDTAVDHVAPGHRRVDVPKRSDTPAATDQARKLKHFYEALLNYFERVGPTNPYRNSNKHLGTYGISVYKLQFDQRKWPKEPQRNKFSSEEEYKTALEEWKFARSEQMPFTLEVVNPVHVIFDPFNDSPEWVIQTTKKQVSQIRKDYPNWPNSNNLRDHRQVEVIEYWDNNERAVIVEGESALRSRNESGVVKHKWRVHPYIIVSSGYGYVDSENRPEKQYVGMLRFIRQMLESESRNYSMADIIMKAGAWPIRVAQGDRANEMPTINLDYGQVHPLPPGVELNNLSPELPPDKVFDFMSVTNGIISGATAPRVVRGLHQPGISSGFDRQLAMGEARLRYGSLVDAQKKAMTQICRKAAIMGEAMVDGQISLTSGATNANFMSINLKNEVKGHYAVNVDINVMEPEDEVRKQQSGMNMVTAGLMSPQEFMKKYRPEVDPDTELGQVLAARIMFGAQMMQLLGGGIAQKVASNLALEEFVQQLLNPEAGGQQSGRDLPEPSGPQNAEPDVDGSRADQARSRELDMRELGN